MVIPPELLHRQPIFLPDGSTRSLETFCDIKVIPGEIEQRREDLKSDITLTARLEGRDLGLVMGAQIQQPLTVAVIGGFVVGLPLLLIVLPAMMRRIYGKYR